MPLYEFQTIFPLTPEQRDQIAMGITDIHSQKFQTPKLFVNVTFTDLADSNAPPKGETSCRTYTYVAGKPRKANKLIAVVRAGPSRTQGMWDELCREVTQLWDSVVGAGAEGETPVKGEDKEKNEAAAKEAAERNEEKELRAIFVLGSMIGGMEAGFPLPQAGKDGEWLQENLEAFRKKAKGGDQDFVEMLEEKGLGVEEGGKEGSGEGRA